MNMKINMFLIMMLVLVGVVSAVTFEDDVASNIDTALLSNGNVVIAYTDGGDSNYGKFIIYDGETIVKNETQFDSVSTNQITVITSGDRFIISYADGADGMTPNFIIYNNSGIEQVSKTELNNTNANYLSSSSLGSDKIVFIFSDSTASKGSYVIYDNAGNYISGAIVFNVGSIYSPSVVELGNGNIALTYGTLSDNWNKVDIYNVTDNSLVANVDTTFTRASNDNQIESARINDTHFIMQFIDLENLDIGRYQIYDNSGSEVGTPVTYHSGYLDAIDVNSYDEGIILAYNDYLDDEGFLAIDDNISMIVDGGTGFNSLSLTYMDDNEVFFAYYDTVLAEGIFDIYDTPFTRIEYTPTIDAYSPLSATIDRNIDDVVNFDITASDLNNEDTLSYSWLVDGIEVITTEDYDYTVAGSVDDDINVTVIVTDDAVLPLSISHEWIITIIEVEVVGGYTASYTSSDLSPIVVDGIGTAGASFVSLLGLITLAVVMLGATLLYKKFKMK